MKKLPWILSLLVFLLLSGSFMQRVANAKEVQIEEKYCVIIDGKKEVVVVDQNFDRNFVIREVKATLEEKIDLCGLESGQVRT